MLDLELIRQHAQSVIDATPVPYLKGARLHGSCFGSVNEQTVSLVDTQFFVDHAEPLEALDDVKERGIWSLGELLEGYEFFLLVKAKGTARSRRSQSGK